MKAQTYNFETWVNETNPKKFKSIENMLLSAGFGIVGKTEHYFEPQGYSCVYLLSESHLSIHTFPEEGCSNIQLSSCVKKPFDNFVKEIVSA